MINIYHGDVLDLYETWERPNCIISDGPYGVNGFPGDPRNVNDLPNIYEPHIMAWSKFALPNTTLYFWNTEIGWATVHPILLKNGWEYRGCNIWDKGINHIAGNCNGQTMKKFPVVTEVCVHYIKNVYLTCNDGIDRSIQDWFRYEWKRTGLSFSITNEICGVKSAATRKYFTSDDLFYPPPWETFMTIIEYANKHGDPNGFPYFEIKPKPSFKHNIDMNIKEKYLNLITKKFNFEYGVSNVWNIPAVRGIERIKNGSKSVHLNQKPLILMDRIIKSSTDVGDVVWEPFGGLFSASISAYNNGRNAFAAEINENFFHIGKERINLLMNS
ncbi:MAG: DNA methyltransferase [Candidimonas sp.]